MDTLSSSDLDSSSKTPLYVAIAAVIVGLAGLGLGWLGFSRASALEEKIGALESSMEGVSGMEARVAESSRRSEQLATNMDALSREVNRVLGEIQTDISAAKKDIRSVVIEAGTNRKRIEELQKAPPAAAPQSAPAASRPAPAGGGSDGPQVAPGEGGVYVIKPGDTLGRIAAQHKVSLDALLQANPGVEPRALRVGQQIVVPAAAGQ